MDREKPTNRNSACGITSRAHYSRTQGSQSVSQSVMSTLTQVTVQVLTLCLVSLPFLVAFSVLDFQQQQHHVNPSFFALSASTSPSSSHHSSNSNARHQFTAMESAVRVEWEPVSELERRIEDGIHYEHWPSNEVPNHRVLGDDNDTTEIHKKQGIFCGFKVTKEEYTRLKSADPDDSTP